MMKQRFFNVGDRIRIVTLGGVRPSPSIIPPKIGSYGTVMLMSQDKNELWLKPDDQTTGVPINLIKDALPCESGLFQPWDHVWGFWGADFEFFEPSGQFKVRDWLE